MPFRPVILIPVYNHDRYLRDLIEKITQKDLPVLLVDDGSGSPCSHTLDTIVRDLDNVSLIRHAKNKGKGAAIVTGFNAAAFSGFTHAFQIDADGQHDIEFIETFLQKWQPNTLSHLSADTPSTMNLFQPFACTPGV